MNDKHRRARLAAACRISSGVALSASSTDAAKPASAPAKPQATPSTPR